MDSRLHTTPADRDSFPSIPMHSSAPATLRCCCGRDDCTLLERNHVALEGVEKDLETAARLGQVRFGSLCFLSYHFDRPCLSIAIGSDNRGALGSCGCMFDTSSCLSFLSDMLCPLCPVLSSVVCAFGFGIIPLIPLFTL